MLKILPIMLALCLMLSSAYYTKNYAGIIGLQLGLTVTSKLQYVCMYVATIDILDIGQVYKLYNYVCTCMYVKHQY